jgi:TetR/AcrR family transcriptional repressor of uid operon
MDAVNAPTQRPRGREAQRLETRKRVFEAAVTEFKRTGTAGADVGAIIDTAGVARGTFYFHFPSKEHVLLELERREETRIAKEFARFVARPHDLPGALRKAVQLVLSVERRVGAILFKDVLGLHFAPTRPPDDEWTDHPLIVLVVEEIGRARDNSEAAQEVDPFHSAVFFLLGLYALLTTTSDSKTVRAAMLDNYVTVALRGMEPR